MSPKTTIQAPLPAPPQSFMAVDAETEVLSKLAERLEFFLSDSNLQKDEWLRPRLDGTKCFVLTKDLMKCNSIRAISKNEDMLVQAAAFLQATKPEGNIRLRSNDCRNMIGRVKPFDAAAAVRPSNTDIALAIVGSSFSGVSPEELVKILNDILNGQCKVTYLEKRHEALIAEFGSNEERELALQILQNTKPFMIKGAEVTVQRVDASMQSMRTNHRRGGHRKAYNKRSQNAVDYGGKPNKKRRSNKGNGRGGNFSSGGTGRRSSHSGNSFNRHTDIQHYGPPAAGGNRNTQKYADNKNLQGGGGRRAMKQTRISHSNGRIPGENSAKRNVCRYFDGPKGCKRGDNCYFLHASPTSADAQMTASSNRAMQKKIQLENMSCSSMSESIDAACVDDTIYASRSSWDNLSINWNNLIMASAFVAVVAFAGCFFVVRVITQKLENR